MKKVQQVDISLGSILKVLGVIFGILLLRQIFDLIVLFLVVLIFVAALNPLVKWLMKEGVPRTASVVIIFLTLFSLLTVLFSLVLSPLVVEVIAFVNRLPELVANLELLDENEGIKNIAQNLSSQLSNAANAVTAGLFVAISSLFGGAVSAVLVAILTFYILVDAPKNQQVLEHIIPAKYVDRIKSVSMKIGDKIGHWVLGQIALSASMFVIVYIGLLIMGVPYSLTLATLAGLLEIVPYMGPIVAGLAAVIIAYGASGWQLALGVLIFYIVINQLENALLVPKIMQKALGLSPILIILAVAIGGKVSGASGAILAVPLLTAVAVVIKEWPNLTKH